MQSKKTSLSVAERKERQGETATLQRGVIYFCHTALVTMCRGYEELGVCLSLNCFIGVIVKRFILPGP